VSERELFRQTADYAADFVETLDTRPIREQASVEELYDGPAGPLPEAGLEPEAVIASLVEAPPGLVEMPSGRSGGATILNDVVLNQVLVRFGDGDHRRETIAGVQQDGTCWLGGTEWAGEHAMRISVSNWRTTTDDVERSAAAILRAAVPVHV
jgi:hypothetical protein